MFYTAWCSKVTTLAILWQWLLHVWKWSPRPIKFSCKKSQETTEDASMPLEKHNGKALLCSGALVAQMWAQTPRKPLSLLHGTWPTMNEPSWWQETYNDMTCPKWATYQWRTNAALITDECCFPIIDQWGLRGKILLKSGGECKNNTNGVTSKWSHFATTLYILCLKPLDVKTGQNMLWSGSKSTLGPKELFAKMTRKQIQWLLD